MPPQTNTSALTSFRLLGTLSLALVLAACAQPQASSALYDSTRENTQRDAEKHVLGDGPRAASQIQLGFGDAGPAKAATSAAAADAQRQHSGATAAVPRPLAEARSFLGTVPCPSGMACEAARISVTLAPSGEWRSRTLLLVGNQPGQTLLNQGCWDVIGTDPLRIALVQPEQAGTMADLSFVNGNTLRVNMLNGAQPMLEHRLTRQADLDPIDELQAKPAITCP